MSTTSDAEKLKEANEIIREMKWAINSLPCSSRDFLGEELWCRINRHFYGVDDPDAEEEEDVKTEEESGESES
jgi:hypothetical protein